MRRSQYARWLAMAVMILVPITMSLFIFTFLAWNNFIGDAANDWIASLFETIRVVYLNNETAFGYAFKVIGAFISMAGVAYGVLRAWFYSDRELPTRLDELVHEFEASLSTKREDLIAVGHSSAHQTNFIGKDANQSPITRLNYFLRSDDTGSDARAFANSTKYFDERVQTLTAATAEARQRLLISRLIRALHFLARDDIEAAFQEFQAACIADPLDIAAASLAASCARKRADAAAEEQFLSGMRHAAVVARNAQAIAESMRRHAESLRCRRSPGDLEQARDLLETARTAIVAMKNRPSEAEHELARINLLFCEIQAARKRVGRLAAPLKQASAVLGTTTDAPQLFDFSGESYGKNRLAALEVQLQILDDADKNDGD